MKIYRNLCAQAVACVVLSSSVIGMDDPMIPQTPPRAGSHSAVPRTPVRPFPASIVASPSSKIPDRPWIYDGTRVVTCDIEADPSLGGRMTEITLIEIQYGEHTGRSLSYFFNPNGRVDYRFVKKVDPIDQSQQPTFEVVARELYDFINGATLVTYGSFDVRKLCEHFGILKPYGQIFEFQWRDALQMEKRDFARVQGEIIFSPSPKKTRVVSESPSIAKKKHAERRKASQEQKEMADLKKYIASQEAHKAGLPSPKRSRTESKFSGVSFKQTDVAARKGISAGLGMMSIGSKAEDLNHRHSIPAEHVGEAHHAMHDTQVLSGILAAQGQPTLKRRIVRVNPVRSARGSGSSQRRPGKENVAADRDNVDDVEAPNDNPKKRALELDFDTSRSSD